MKPSAPVLLLLLLGACGGADPSGALGAAVDASAVVPLADALALDIPAEVTVRGEVGSVCTASGCWFTLRERSGDVFRDLHVDLLPAAGFRLEPSAVGRTVLVRGRLAGDATGDATTAGDATTERRELHALGLAFE